MENRINLPYFFVWCIYHPGKRYVASKAELAELRIKRNTGSENNIICISARDLAFWEHKLNLLKWSKNPFSGGSIKNNFVFPSHTPLSWPKCNCHFDWLFV